MQKILFLVLFVTILPVYGFAETYDESKCDIIETDSEVIEIFRNSGIYKGSELNGILCYINKYNYKNMVPIKNGKAEGIKKSYYENGVLQFEELYKNDKQAGVEKEYYESGVLLSETLYKDGKKEGIGKLYYESGALNVEIPYKNNKKEGLGKIYNEKGKLTATLTYKNGEAISGKCNNGRDLTSYQFNKPEMVISDICD